MFATTASRMLDSAVSAGTTTDTAPATSPAFQPSLGYPVASISPAGSP